MESELTFNTTDASEMFFKNLRQSAYEVENRDEVGIKVCKHRKLKNLNCMLKPSLVFNWRIDKAFIIFDSLQHDQYHFKIGTREIDFDPSNQKNHAILALKIYNAIILNESIEVDTAQSNYHSFFYDAEAKDIFRITVYDFLRMVEIR